MVDDLHGVICMVTLFLDGQLDPKQYTQESSALHFLRAGYGRSGGIAAVMRTCFAQSEQMLKQEELLVMCMNDYVCDASACSHAVCS